MRRILLITGPSPYPPVTGATQRTNLLHRALALVGRVDMLLLADPSRLDPAQLRRLREEFGLVECVSPVPPGRRGVWRLIRSVDPSRVDFWANALRGREADYAPDQHAGAALERCLQAARYDVVVGRYLAPLAKTGALRLSPVIVDVDDMDTSLCRSRLADPCTPTWRRVLFRRDLAQLERIVPEKLARCAGLWVSNESDRSLPGLERATVLPNIPFTPCDSVGISPLAENHGSKVVTTVGTLSYPPNVTGVDHFLRDVWPVVKEAVPDAVFRIIGSKLCGRLRDRWARLPGVEPVGFVEDLKTAYQACAFTVTPVVSGGGTHIKVLESLSYGRTCVLTSFALRGYETILRHGECLYVADRAAELAEGCVQLLNDPELRAKMAKRGASLVRGHFSFERFARVVKSGVEAVSRAHAGIQPILPKTSL